jgi:hypothetical protein
MKEVETLHEEEFLTVGKLKEIIENLPDEMPVSDVYLGQLIEVDRVAIFREHEESEDNLVIG